MAACPQKEICRRTFNMAATPSNTLPRLDVKGAFILRCII